MVPEWIVPSIVQVYCKLAESMCTDTESLHIRGVPIVHSL